MKESYIQQVKRHLTLTRKQKQEVLRDLEEIFASALEHGESEDQVIARLGTPEEYARSVEGPLEKRRGGTALVGLVVSCVVCVGACCSFPLHSNLVGAERRHRVCPGEHLHPGRRQRGPLPPSIDPWGSGVGRGCLVCLAPLPAEKRSVTP